MNGTGHQKIVELVNSGLERKFPEAELFVGAVDPDAGKYQSYTGIESKHHYHPRTAIQSSGRTHDVGEILEIVYRRIHNARMHWLANKRDISAFEFGVATHYFMDGFICSPSVDESMHDKGDRSFTKTASDSVAPLIRDINQASQDSAQNLILDLSSNFGMSDSDVVSNALQVLLDLACMVTDNPIPKPFCNEINSAIKDFRAKAAQIDNFYKDKALVAKELNSLFRTRLEKIIKRPHIVLPIVISHLNKISFSALIIKISHNNFYKAVENAFQKKMPGEFHLPQWYAHISKSISSQKCDLQWYEANSVGRYRTDSLSELREINHNYLTLINFQKKLISEKCKNLLKKHDRLVATEIHKYVEKEKWFYSWMRWLGEKSENDSKAKYIFTIFSAVVVWAFFIILKTVGIIPIPTLLLTIIGIMDIIITWAFLKTCRDLWNFCYKTIKAGCPKCRTVSNIYFDRHTRIAYCPECGQKLNN